MNKKGKFYANNKSTAFQKIKEYQFECHKNIQEIQLKAQNEKTD